jgi:hypothetical protein
MGARRDFVVSISSRRTGSFDIILCEHWLPATPALSSVLDRSGT